MDPILEQVLLYQDGFELVSKIIAKNDFNHDSDSSLENQISHLNSLLDVSKMAKKAFSIQTDGKGDGETVTVLVKFNLVMESVRQDIRSRLYPKLWEHLAAEIICGNRDMVLQLLKLLVELIYFLYSEIRASDRHDLVDILIQNSQSQISSYISTDKDEISSQNTANCYIGCMTACYVLEVGGKYDHLALFAQSLEPKSLKLLTCSDRKIRLPVALDLLPLLFSASSSSKDLASKVWNVACSLVTSIDRSNHDDGLAILSRNFTYINEKEKLVYSEEYWNVLYDSLIPYIDPNVNDTRSTTFNVLSLKRAIFLLETSVKHIIAQQSDEYREIGNIFIVNRGEKFEEVWSLFFMIHDVLNQGEIHLVRKPLSNLLRFRAAVNDKLIHPRWVELLFRKALANPTVGCRTMAIEILFGTYGSAETRIFEMSSEFFFDVLIPFLSSSFMFSTYSVAGEPDGCEVPGGILSCGKCALPDSYIQSREGLPHTHRSMKKRNMTKDEKESGLGNMATSTIDLFYSHYSSVLKSKEEKIVFIRQIIKVLGNSITYRATMSAILEFFAICDDEIAVEVFNEMECITDYRSFLIGNLVDSASSAGARLPLLQLAMVVWCKFTYKNVSCDAFWRTVSLFPLSVIAPRDCPGRYWIDWWTNQRKENDLYAVVNEFLSGKSFDDHRSDSTVSDVMNSIVPRIALRLSFTDESTVEKCMKLLSSVISTMYSHSYKQPGKIERVIHLVASCLPYTFQNPISEQLARILAENSSEIAAFTTMCVEKWRTEERSEPEMDPDYCLDSPSPNLHAVSTLSTLIRLACQLQYVQLHKPSDFQTESFLDELYLPVSVLYKALFRLPSHVSRCFSDYGGFLPEIKALCLNNLTESKNSLAKTATMNILSGIAGTCSASSDEILAISNATSLNDTNKGKYRMAMIICRFYLCKWQSIGRFLQHSSTRLDNDTLSKLCANYISDISVASYDILVAMVDCLHDLFKKLPIEMESNILEIIEAVGDALIGTIGEKNHWSEIRLLVKASFNLVNADIRSELVQEKILGLLMYLLDNAGQGFASYLSSVCTSVWSRWLCSPNPSDNKFSFSSLVIRMLCHPVKELPYSADGHMQPCEALPSDKSAAKVESSGKSPFDELNAREMAVTNSLGDSFQVMSGINVAAAGDRISTIFDNTPLDILFKEFPNSSVTTVFNPLVSGYRYRSIVSSQIPSHLRAYDPLFGMSREMLHDCPPILSVREYYARAVMNGWIFTIAKQLVSLIDTKESISLHIEILLNVIEQLLEELGSERCKFPSVNQYKINIPVHRRRIRIWQSITLIWPSLSLVPSHPRLEAYRDRFNQIEEDFWRIVYVLDQPSVRSFIDSSIFGFGLRHPTIFTRKIFLDGLSPNNWGQVARSAGLVLGAYFEEMCNRTPETAGVIPDSKVPLPILDRQSFCEIISQLLVCSMSPMHSVRSPSQYALTRACEWWESQKDESNEDEERIIQVCSTIVKKYKNDVHVLESYEKLVYPDEILREALIGSPFSTLFLTLTFRHNPGPAEAVPPEIYDLVMGKIPSILPPTSTDNNNEKKGKEIEEEPLILGDFQAKIIPLNQLFSYEQLWEEFSGMQPRARRTAKLPLIVVATYIDKVPNLAGLCRTCECFGATSLIVADKKLTMGPQFRSMAVTSDRWLDIEEVPEDGLFSFFSKKREEGYSIVGIEQTENSESLGKISFPKKTVLVLGKEKEGIPIETIHAMDKCVHIPQLGVVRSLNVHVTGAIVTWTYVGQHLGSVTQSDM